MITLQSASAGFIYNDQGEVLLVKEAYGRFRYGAPGGVVEQGESPQAACIREVREETGLQVSVDYLIGIRWTCEDREVPWLGYAFRCSIVAGSLSIQDSAEIAEVGWRDPYSPPEPTTQTASLMLVPGLLGQRGLVFGL